jgi:hypothetical protein
MTVWIHSSTLGIEKNCFDGTKRVARILVWGQEQHGVRTAVLATFIAKLRVYEPALVDLIREVATHIRTWAVTKATTTSIALVKTRSGVAKT